MSVSGNSSFLSIQPSDHDQNPYDVAADMIKEGLLTSAASLPNGTSYSNYSYWDQDTVTWKTETSNRVHIGNNAGLTNQGLQAIAIGENAGSYTQGTESLAIGSQAGRTNQQQGAVGLGYQAGNDNQGSVLWL